MAAACTFYSVLQQYFFVYARPYRAWHDDCPFAPVREGGGRYLPSSLVSFGNPVVSFADDCPCAGRGYPFAAFAILCYTEL